MSRPPTPEAAGPDAARPPRASRTRWLTVAIGVVAVLGVLALLALVWYIFFRPAGPPPIGPGAPLIPEGWLFDPVLLASGAVFA